MHDDFGFLNGGDYLILQDDYFKSRAPTLEPWSAVNVHTFLYAMFSAEIESNTSDLVKLFTDSREKIEAIGPEATLEKINHIIDMEPTYDTEHLTIIAKYLLDLET